MSAADDLEAFVALSALLTGFPAADIGDPLDPDQLATVYLDVVKAQAAGTVAPLLAAFAQARAAAGGDAAQLVERVTTAIWNDEALGGLARQIVRLWYLGRWNGGPYVSSAAYVRALAWKAMDAKAIGYSEFTDQYWAKPPQ